MIQCFRVWIKQTFNIRCLVVHQVDITTLSTTHCTQCARSVHWKKSCPAEGQDNYLIVEASPLQFYLRNVFTILWWQLTRRRPLRTWGWRSWFWQPTCCQLILVTLHCRAAHWSLQTVCWPVHAAATVTNAPRLNYLLICILRVYKTKTSDLYFQYLTVNQGQILASKTVIIYLTFPASI